MDPILLMPNPRCVKQTGGLYRAALPMAIPPECSGLVTLFPELYQVEKSSPIRFLQDSSILHEGYRLEITQTHIQITSGDPAGRFYALVTLGQMLMQRENLFCCVIEDAPRFPMRGFLLDISRGRVPRMETLTRLVDILASFKYNQLQLYIEGFSFDYPSFPQIMAGHTPITPEELKRLDAYCRERHISLVPNQNSLGHMAPWLARPEYRELAEKEDGLELFGHTFPPTTLNASDPRSLALVERMLGDLLPCFSSQWVNVNLDEAFELGKGKNKAYAEAHGADRLFLEYAKKLHGYLLKKGKRMMMWADSAANSPLLRRELPKDILLLEWGYEAEHPFADRASALEKAGRRYCVCPGTSSWSSFTGNTDNMLKNIASALDAADRHHGEGMLLTDWGDMGHLQPPPVSWPAIVFAGCLAWDPERKPSEHTLAKALDRFLFLDSQGKMGALALDMGRYNRMEPFRMGCRTLACMPILLGPMPADRYGDAVVRFAGAMARMAPEEVAPVYLEEIAHRKQWDIPAILEETERLENRLAAATPLCADRDLVLDGYRCALRSVQLLTKANGLLLEGKRDPMLAAEFSGLIALYRTLWQRQAKPDGLESGLRGFVRLAEYFSEGDGGSCGM